MKVILIAQASEFDQENLQRLKAHGQVIEYRANHTTIEEIKELSDSDPKIIAVSPVPFNWEIPDGFYLSLNQVKYLCLPTTSTSFINLNKCHQFGIQVTNIPHYATQAVAEQAIFMLFALLRRLPAQIHQNFNYEFNASVLGDETTGKTVGIIGLGDIGTKIAESTSSLGMKVIYWSPHHRDARYEYVDLNVLLNSADVIFPTVAATPETQNLLPAEKLKQLKPTSYFISTVDLSIWDKNYLIQRAKAGELSGLAYETDAAAKQPIQANILTLPSFAWYTKQSLQNNINLWADNIISCLNNQPRNLVSI